MNTVHVRVRVALASDQNMERIGDDGEQAVLEVDGTPLLRGNRSRIVAITSDIETNPNLDRLVVARGIAHGFSISHLSWCPRSSVLVHVAQCFGSVTLKHVRQGHFISRVRRVRVGDGVPLVLAVENKARVAAVTAVFLVERHLGARPVSSVRLKGGAALSAELGPSSLPRRRQD